MTCKNRMKGVIVMIVKVSVAHWVVGAFSYSI